MVDIHIEDGLATFRIAGLHKLWALKSRIVVPVEDIVAVEGFEAVPRWAGWRIAGTWVPGIFGSPSTASFAALPTSTFRSTAAIFR